MLNSSDNLHIHNTSSHRRRVIRYSRALTVHTQNKCQRRAHLVLVVASLTLVLIASISVVEIGQG